MTVREASYNSLTLPFGWVTRKVYGGPYTYKPSDFVGIKCAQEMTEKYAMRVDIPDFGVPRRPEQMQQALKFALDRLAEGMPIYVGCKGGQGRTGLFLALLARSLGVVDPVGYVRQNYNPHAVETVEQVEYLYAFDLSEVEAAAERAKAKALWYSFWRFWTFGYFPRSV